MCRLMSRPQMGKSTTVLSLSLRNEFLLSKRFRWTTRMCGSLFTRMVLSPCRWVSHRPQYHMLFLSSLSGWPKFRKQSSSVGLPSACDTLGWLMTRIPASTSICSSHGPSQSTAKKTKFSVQSSPRHPLISDDEDGRTDLLRSSNFVGTPLATGSAAGPNLISFGFSSPSTRRTGIFSPPKPARTASSIEPGFFVSIGGDAGLLQNRRTWRQMCSLASAHVELERKLIRMGKPKRTRPFFSFVSSLPSPSDGTIPMCRRLITAWIKLLV
mmetsp:Transcript_15063/g.30078  ORF Transcript_15063/g.30078 Transcript_15063/m.30078 type:complete len:269 (+) Transcript_15063:445-1251(+)